MDSNSWCMDGFDKCEMGGGGGAVVRGFYIGNVRYNVTAAFSLHGFVAWDIRKCAPKRGDAPGVVMGINNQEKFIEFVAFNLVSPTTCLPLW